MYRVLLIISLLSFSIQQKGIDYNPKALSKSLKKVWDIEDVNLKEIPIADSMTQNLNGKYYQVLTNENVSTNNYIYIGRVNSCRAGGCSAVIDSSHNTQSEYFDYFILLDSAITVQHVKIYNYAATHGQEITAKGWLKQFEGYAGDKALYIGKDIDAISGATISVYGISADIQHKTFLLRQFLK